MMKGVIWLLICFLGYHSTKASDTTFLKGHVAIGTHLNIMPRLLKNNISFDSDYNIYNPRKGPRPYSNSFNFQLGLQLRIYRNLYAYSDYNFISQKAISFDGETFKALRYFDDKEKKFSKDSISRYVFKSKISLVNLGLKLRAYPNKEDKRHFFQIGSGIGLGYMHRLKQESLEFARPLYYGAELKRYDYVAEIENAAFYGLNSSAEIGRQFKKIDVVLGIEFNRINYSKVNYRGEFLTDKMHQNYFRWLLSAYYNF
jgi:hypothetical protein